MPLWSGFYVNEAFHRVCMLDEERGAILSSGVQNTERDLLEDCYDEMARLRAVSEATL